MKLGQTILLLDLDAIFNQFLIIGKQKLECKKKRGIQRRSNKWYYSVVTVSSLLYPLLNCRGLYRLLKVTTGYYRLLYTSTHYYRLLQVNTGY